MEVAGGLDLESEGLRKVFGMGDRIRSWHVTGSSCSSKKRAREGTYMCRVRIGDHVILYFLFFLSKTLCFQVRERLDCSDGNCAFCFDPVTESRSNYMSMRNACLMNLMFANLLKVECYGAVVKSLLSPQEGNWRAFEASMGNGED